MSTTKIASNRAGRDALLVIDGDPYRDLGVLLGDGQRIPAIMVRGRFVKNEL